MKIDNIQFREVQSSDFPTLHNIMRKEWFKRDYEDFPEETSALIQLYLYRHLERGTIGIVAEVNQEVVGVILGTVHSKAPKLRMLNQDITPSLLTLFKAPKPFREGLLASLRTEIKNFQTLLEDTKTDYEGEILLFIVSKDYKGIGIGSKLFSSLLNHFDENHVNRYFLFTDDSSNIGFYEYKGLRQVNSISDDEGFSQYLYDNG